MRLRFGDEQLRSASRWTKRGSQNMLARRSGVGPGIRQARQESEDPPRRRSSRRTSRKVAMLAAMVVV